MGPRHVVVDESMRNGYLLVAAVVMPQDVNATRRGIQDLVERGQRRLHMVKESPPRKRMILQRLTELGVTATLYEAGPNHRRTSSAGAHAWNNSSSTPSQQAELG